MCRSGRSLTNSVYKVFVMVSAFSWSHITGRIPNRLANTLPGVLNRPSGHETSTNTFRSLKRRVFFKKPEMVETSEQFS